MNAGAVEITGTPALQADAAVFQFPRGATWLLLLALLMAVAEAVLLLFRIWNTPDPSTRLTQIPEFVFLSLVAEMNWRLIRRSRRRVAVNAAGIWAIRGRVVKYVPWLNVARVTANDTVQRIDLIDRSGATTISVDYQLKNFERLREFILLHTRENTQFQPPGVGTFHRLWELKLIYAALGAIALFVAWQMRLHGGGGESVLPVVLAAIAIFMILREPVTVSAGQDGIVIKYICFQGLIPFNSITGIAFSDVRYRWNVWAGVVITTARKERIRLSRFREGSVALYEALQTAWKQAAGAQGFAIPIPPAAPGIMPQKRIGSPSRPLIAPRTRLALVSFILLAVALPWCLSRTGLIRVIAERSLLDPVYEQHIGLIANSSDLKGKGRVYLIQLGPHSAPYSLDDFARWLHAKYAVNANVLPALPISPAALDVKRRLLVAEQLEMQIKQKHPDLASDQDAYLIGFTDREMYSTNEMWSSVFTQRDTLRTAVISSYGMGDTSWQRARLDPSGAVARFQSRMRRILLKDVAILYWHLPLNQDPTSLLHNPLDPDLPTEEIYKSDVDPASSAAGQQMSDPCIFFSYSAKDGMKPLPGPLIRECDDVQDPMENDSIELFELVLRVGLLIDKHTDLYLPDTIPIEFQRVIREGERGRNPFGISGTDNYDDFLASRDNIRILVVHDDGSHDDLMRYPRWLPSLLLVKYVGGPSETATIQGEWGPTTGKVWLNEMAWHEFPYPHYDISRFNGGVKSYLPCSGSTVYCYITDYHDSQGRELKFQRDSDRHLRRLTSPGGNWIALNDAADGRITSITDNKMQAIAYSYDAKNRLTQVTYPSGAVYKYEYDGQQHMMTFSVSADGHSKATVALRNKYKNGVLTKQTFAGGDTYIYSYIPSDPDTVQRIKVYTPGGSVFDVQVGSDHSTVHELNNQP